VRNAEVLQRVKGERNILQSVKGNWSGHILHWNCLLEQVTEGDRGKDSSEGQTRIMTEEAAG
jgi:hypothetical protein